ncbi:ABC transporter ATP-binding protein [Paraoerskovia marina]|uniref:ABC transporter ATP-binding protein n=1 Tax=Paraoerskovia marina TaxID=545619 RepID=UPI0004926569|nr:ABC transporter ATP-binding protein [Paraoerskovia marina]
MTALRARALTRTYPGGVEALRGVDLDVEPGERVAIVGRSGAGKSTLLNALGLLDEPTSGSYRLLGEETVGLDERRRDHLRRRALGFVFQDAHVLGQRTVAENLTVKLATSRVPRAERPPRIADSLARVGLSHRRDAAGRLLSGGEKQRLAIARAILTSPAVILADEPTGNLDGVNSQVVRDLFDEQARDGVAVVVITHDDRVAAWADRSVILQDGQFTEAMPQ